jgi:hypothetical protein
MITQMIECLQLSGDMPRALKNLIDRTVTAAKPIWSCVAVRAVSHGPDDGRHELFVNCYW